MKFKELAELLTKLTTETGIGEATVRAIDLSLGEPGGGTYRIQSDQTTTVDALSLSTEIGWVCENWLTKGPTAQEAR